MGGKWGRGGSVLEIVCEVDVASCVREMNKVKGR